MLAKNIPNTSNDECFTHNSWLDFWEEKAEDEAFCCSNKICKNDAEVGAHVFISDQILLSENKRNTGEYLVPLCKKCNHPDNTDWFEIFDFIKPIKI